MVMAKVTHVSTTPLGARRNGSVHDMIEAHNGSVHVEKRRNRKSKLLQTPASRSSTSSQQDCVPKKKILLMGQTQATILHAWL
jgi:hypothetical protein